MESEVVIGPKIKLKYGFDYFFNERVVPALMLVFFPVPPTDANHPIQELIIEVDAYDVGEIFVTYGCSFGQLQ